MLYLCLALPLVLFGLILFFIAGVGLVVVVVFLLVLVLVVILLFVIIVLFLVLVLIVFFLLLFCAGLVVARLRLGVAVGLLSL